MSKKAASKQTVAQIKAAAKARIDEQTVNALEAYAKEMVEVIEGVDVPEEIKVSKPNKLSKAKNAKKIEEPVDIKASGESTPGGAMIPANGAYVAPLSLEDRARLGDKDAQAKLDAMEAEFDKLTGSDKLQAKLSGKAPKKAKVASGKSARIDLLGHPVTSVLRWMGKNGWSKPEARYACNQLGVAPAEGTIQIQVLAGKKGERGEPASLSSENIKKLDALRKATPA